MVPAQPVRDAGHIIGSSFLELDAEGEKRVIFSGDLGNRGKPIIRDPSFPGPAGAIVVETTYADRDHRTFSASAEELRDVVAQVFSRGGNVLIPSFAVERAQDLHLTFRDLLESGKLPACRVFLDSPMGINVVSIMRRHPDVFDAETRVIVRKNGDPFLFPGLEFTRTPEESRQINFVKRGAVIIAGSGMCTGGRILHHLKHNIWRPESAIVFIGYQAEGTLGRTIVNGDRTVPIFGSPYRVSASVHTIGGFSSHADRGILLEWLGRSAGVQEVFLVHGEGAKVVSFRQELLARGISPKVTVPGLGDRVTL